MRPEPRRTNVLILPVVQQEWGRTFSCMIWAGCLEQAPFHICWQMCTVQSEALRKLSGGDGLKINSGVVSVSESLLAKRGRGGMAVPMQRLQTRVFQAKMLPATLCGPCQERLDNAFRKGQISRTVGTILILILQAYQGWSLNLHGHFHQRWNLEPTPLQRDENCPSPCHR